MALEYPAAVRFLLRVTWGLNKDMNGVFVQGIRHNMKICGHWNSECFKNGSEGVRNWSEKDDESKQ